MHNDLPHFDLTFPSIPVGDKEARPSLRRLLYKGGASLRPDLVDEKIEKGLLGEIQSERVELVHKIHEVINDDLVAGGSVATARSRIAEITRFFVWVDESGAALNLAEALTTYLNWSEHLWQRLNVNKDIKRGSAYNSARQVGQILDGALGRAKPMVKLTRIKRGKVRNTPQGAKADKQNLGRTFAFGRLLQDICDGTPLSVIWGAPIVRIPLQQGTEIEFKPSSPKRLPDDKRDPYHVRKSIQVALAYEADRSLDHRFRKSIVNLRIQAELLMFIGQTGMNLAQAQNLPLRKFSYSSDIDGYKVREYKPRRQGEVLFEIFRGYRGHFERYLDWRRELFPDKGETRLFPFIRQHGARLDATMGFEAIREACKKAVVGWVPPSLLRGTRVNWLLRRSGDPDMAAEMAQHSKKMLLTVYETPSLQRAVTEVTTFWQRNDPALAGTEPVLAVAPGKCDGTPEVSPAKPESAPEPDCMRPSGCLWCTHHRDIDTFDYVWSLACFRHLKLIELSKQLPAEKEGAATHPAEHVTQRLGQKLTWFRESNPKRREWVEESLARVEESYYHDQWGYMIEAMEGSSK